MLIAFLNHNDEDSNTIYITEDTDLRTGPNAIYPTIKPANQGQSYNKIGKSGKWIEVESSNHKDKGWVAGWHTNLNIQADANVNEKPLKDKTILDPGHGGSDQGASSNTKRKVLKKFTLKTAKEMKNCLKRRCYCKYDEKFR